MIILQILGTIGLLSFMFGLCLMTADVLEGGELAFKFFFTPVASLLFCLCMFGIAAVWS